MFILSRISRLEAELINLPFPAENCHVPGCRSSYLASSKSLLLQTWCRMSPILALGLTRCTYNWFRGRRTCKGRSECTRYHWRGGWSIAKKRQLKMQPKVTFEKATRVNCEMKGPFCSTFSPSVRWHIRLALSVAYWVVIFLQLNFQRGLESRLIRPHLQPEGGLERLVGHLRGELLHD